MKEPSRFQGILIEYDEKDDGQKVRFRNFVVETLECINKLGKNTDEWRNYGKFFLDEFQAAPSTFHEHEGKKYSLLIRPPMVISLGGKDKAFKIAVMETKKLAASSSTAQSSSSAASSSGTPPKIAVMETKKLAASSSTAQSSSSAASSSGTPPKIAVMATKKSAASSSTAQSSSSAASSSAATAASSSTGHAQIIECWWPGSENSELRKGIKILPEPWGAAEAEKRILLAGKVAVKDIDSACRPTKEGGKSKLSPNETYQLKEGEFFYHKQLHTFQIALIHEMIHAYYGIKGQSRAGTGGDPAAEEKLVVGIGEHWTKKYTENKFRALLGLPSRVDYKGLKVDDTWLKSKAGLEFVKAYETWCKLL